MPDQQETISVHDNTEFDHPNMLELLFTHAVSTYSQSFLDVLLLMVSSRAVKMNFWKRETRLVRSSCRRSRFNRWTWYKKDIQVDLSWHRRPDPADSEDPFDLDDARPLRAQPMASKHDPWHIHLLYFLRASPGPFRMISWSASSDVTNPFVSQRIS